MKRRTLLATAGGATLFGTAGCFGIASLISGDNSDEETDEQETTDVSGNASDSHVSDEVNTESNETSENTTDGESNETSETSSRPEDPVDTISVTDHGLDVSKSPDPDVDKEVYCFGTFEIGDYDLRKVRIDAVALDENGDRLDHGWVPFAQAAAGESYDVEIPFYINPDEIAEYLIGATEAQYMENNG